MTRTRISVETHRRTVIHFPHRLTVWCDGCGQEVQMIAADEAAVLAGVSTRTIYRRVETAQLHYSETPGGKLFICPNSLTQ
jgi:hypothetical protein